MPEDQYAHFDFRGRSPEELGDEVARALRPFMREGCVVVARVQAHIIHPSPWEPPTWVGNTRIDTEDPLYARQVMGEFWDNYTPYTREVGRAVRPPVRRPNPRPSMWELLRDED